MKTETTPQHLSPEFWAECVEVRQFLINTFEGLVDAVGILESDSDQVLNLEFYLASIYDYEGAIIYNRQAREFIVSNRLIPNNADYETTIRTVGRPTSQIVNLLRESVKLLAYVE